MFLEFILNFWLVLKEAAPWLLFGYFVAAIIAAFIPKDLLTKHLGGKGYMPSIKAAFIGAPLPLCSCGVVPAALALRKSGASKSATSSFLVATPETGVDSIFVSYALLGPFMAIIRPIAAIFSAICAGFLVEKFADDNYGEEVKTKSCCSSIKDPVKTQTKKTSSCCSSKVENKKVSIAEKIKNSLKSTINDVVKNTSLWLLIGLIFAGLMRTVIPEDFSSFLGNDWIVMFIMLVVGIPLYVCATASTPIAAGFLLSGISPGSVLVFMLTGPATNLATLGIIRQSLGTKTLIMYLTGVMTTALAFGVITNLLVKKLSISVQASQISLFPNWFTSTTAIGLIVLLCYGIYLKFRK